MPITTSGTPVATRNDRLADFPALQRRFDQAGFQQASQTHGVDASVLVQVLNSEAETTEFLRLATARAAASPAKSAGRISLTRASLTNWPA
jgi:predicted TIM-barrel fold metal-dependent hydrolase